MFLEYVQFLYYSSLVKTSNSEETWDFSPPGGKIQVKVIRYQEERQKFDYTDLLKGRGELKGKKRNLSYFNRTATDTIMVDKEKGFLKEGLNCPTFILASQP